MNYIENLIESAVSSGSVVIFSYDQFFKDRSIFGANQMRVLAIDDGVFLAVYKKRRNLTLPYVLEFDLKRIVLKLAAVLLGELQRQGNHKLWCFDVFASDFEGDHFEGIERGVDDHQNHVSRPVAQGVEESRGGAHRSTPEHEPRESQLAQPHHHAISMSGNKY